VDFLLASSLMGLLTLTMVQPDCSPFSNTIVGATTWSLSWTSPLIRSVGTESHPHLGMPVGMARQPGHLYAEAIH